MQICFFRFKFVETLIEKIMENILLFFLAFIVGIAFTMQIIQIYVNYIVKKGDISKNEIDFLETIEGTIYTPNQYFYDKNRTKLVIFDCKLTHVSNGAVKLERNASKKDSDNDTITVFYPSNIKKIGYKNSKANENETKNT